MGEPSAEEKVQNPYAAPAYGPVRIGTMKAVWLRVVAVVAAGSGFAHGVYWTLVQWDRNFVWPSIAAVAVVVAVAVLLAGPLRREGRLLLWHGDLWVPLLLFTGFSQWEFPAMNALAAGSMLWRQERAVETVVALAVLGFASVWTVRMAVQVVDEGRCAVVDAVGFALRWVPRVEFVMLVMWVGTFLLGWVTWRLGIYASRDFAGASSVVVTAAINLMSMAVLPLAAVGREPLWDEAGRAWSIARREAPRWWWMALAQLAVIGVATWTGWAYPSTRPWHIHSVWTGGLYGQCGWAADVMPAGTDDARCAMIMGVSGLAIGALAIAVMLRVVSGIRRHDPRRGLEIMRHGDALGRVATKGDA